MTYDNPIKKFFMTTVAFQKGIVPIESPLHDVNRALATLSPEEARTAKRKFRKLWRKLAAGVKKAGKNPRQVDNRFGFKTQAPSKSQKTNRKTLVALHISREAARLEGGKD
jgi:hypothetical protein